MFLTRRQAERDPRVLGSSPLKLQPTRILEYKAAAFCFKELNFQINKQIS